MTLPMIQTLTNESWQAATGHVSVLIPFHGDDPTPLLTQLDRTSDGEVEVILFDDGCPDCDLNARVATSIEALKLPARLISSRVNHGRSGARNRLADAARGDWLLFLDADMDVDDDFLTRWLTHTRTTQAAALFGGFEPASPTPETRVHAALAQASDVHSVEDRRGLGAIAVCSSNLAVRRDVFATVPFDDGYRGWGWEDVDWALSASKVCKLDHVDNPARHGGLESVDRLLGKFAQSGPNFARLLDRHPDYGDRPGARLARKVKAFRSAGLARLAGAAAARLPLPLGLRVLGLKLYRAGIAAEAL
jgi:hypothetical protein